MKKLNKFSKIFIFILAIFCTLNATLAFYTTSTSNVSTFNTKKYTFILNASGGIYESSNVSIVDGKTTLPTPTKKGYNFLGYSNSLNGNIDYSINIDNVLDINNKEIYANWGIVNYSITYNLNGGSISNHKTNYTVEDTFTLPTPTKTGNSFIGWSGSNGNTPQINVTIPKGTTENLNYSANWSVNSYLVDINPVIDGTTYYSGLDGYTFDVWVNGVQVADNVIDWCQNVSYGSSIRVKTNSHDGMNTNYDTTITVGVDGANITPIWYKNYYTASYYVNGNLYTTSSVGYGDSLPNHTYSLNPWEVWDGWSNLPSSMPSNNIRIDGYYHEANCYVWAGHPKAQNGYAIMTQVVKAAKNDFTGVVGPYESTSINGTALWTMNTDSLLKYSQVISRLGTSMNRYVWWSYAEIHCDNGYATAYYK